MVFLPGSTGSLSCWKRRHQIISLFSKAIEWPDSINYVLGPITVSAASIQVFLYRNNKLDQIRLELLFAHNYNLKRFASTLPINLKVQRAGIIVVILLKYILRHLFNWFCLVVPLFTISGQNISSQEIVQASIAYHDPNGMWGKLYQDFKVQSSRDTLTLKLYNDRGMVEWTQKLNDGRFITAGYVSDSCFVKIDGKSIEPRGKIENLLLDCPQVISRSNYFLYMYGLPMKLKDAQAIIDPIPEKVNFLGKEYWSVKVHYNSPDGGRWQFYFDTDSFSFEIAQYFHSEHADNSEYIVFDSPLKVGQMVLPARHSWYLFKNRQFIGSELLVRSEE